MLRIKKSAINGIMFDASEPLHPLLSQYLASKGAIVNYLEDCVEITGAFSLPNQKKILAELENFSIKHYGAIVYDIKTYKDINGNENFKVLSKPGYEDLDSSFERTENSSDSSFTPEINIAQNSEKPNAFTPTFTEKVNATPKPAKKADESTFKGLKKGFLLGKP